MDIKMKLKTHANLLRKIQITEQQLGSLSEGIELPATTNVSQTPVQGGEIYDHLPTNLHRLETMRRELEGLYVLRDQEHDELWKIVSALPCVNEIYVLRAYYFWLQSRLEVAQHLFGDREDFQRRRTYYQKKTSQLHTDAMSRLRADLKNSLVVTK